MKHLISLLPALMALTCISCGISDEKIHQMEASLSYNLGYAYLYQSNIMPANPEIELRNVQKGESYVSPKEGYHGQFSFAFTDKGHPVLMVGAVGFDKDGNVAICQDGKFAIDPTIIMVDNKQEQTYKSPYNLPMFGGLHPK